MKYLLDTASLADITRFCDIFPIAGVTSNPSIVKKEGKINFFAHMNEIRSIIGPERPLHIQVTALDTEGMIRDADTLLTKIDADVYVKAQSSKRPCNRHCHLQQPAGFSGHGGRRRLYSALFQPHGKYGAEFRGDHRCTGRDDSALSLSHRNPGSQLQKCRTDRPGFPCRRPYSHHGPLHLRGRAHTASYHQCSRRF